MPRNDKRNNNNNNKNNAGRGKKPTKKTQKRRTTGFSRKQALPRLGACSSKYFLAIAKPFSEGARGACIPTFPSRASQKTTALLRGTFTCGSYGHGWVAVAPTLVNNYASVFSTRSTFAGNSVYVDIDNTTTAGYTYGVDVIGDSVTQLPYERAELQNGNGFSGATIRGRIVSYGLRVRYIGTTLDMSGRMAMFVSPTHDNLNGATYSVVSSRPEAFNLTVSRAWSELSIYADTTDETEYPGGNREDNSITESIRATFPLSNMESVGSGTGSDYIGGVPMVIMIEALPNSTFEYEVVAHVEYVGKPAASMLSKTHTDIDGMSKVQDAASGSMLGRAGGSERTSWTSMLKNLGAEIANHGAQMGAVAGGFRDAYRTFNAGSLLSIQDGW